MKKIFILCSLILIGCGGQIHEDGPYTSYYENGKIRSEGTYKNDIQVGVWKKYHEDGTTSSESTYKENGHLVISTDYYKDGTVKSERTNTYENLRDGPHDYTFFTLTNYNEDGTPQEKYTFDASSEMLIGPAVYYWANGNREEHTYVNSTKEGPAVYYWASGSREERTYVNGTKEGPAVYYWADGGREEHTYVNGKLEGPYVFYSSDSGKWKGDRREGTYVNNKKEGPAVYYWASGKILKETYVNGKKQGSTSTSSSKSYNSSSGSQKGVYDLRKGEITFRIVVREDSSVPGELFYSGFSSVYGVEGNVSGIIKNNTLYEDGAFKMGTIDRNGKWIKYNGHTISKR